MDKLREDAGKRLLPHVIDELGRGDPDRILYEIPVESDKVDAGYTNISARQYANAINRAAWWLENNLGKGIDFPTIGYVGPGDLRYFILVIAAIKTGYKMLYTSPRNSLEGDLAVIEAANCNIWLVPSRGSNIQRVLVVRPTRVVDIPDIDFFLDPKLVGLYEYKKTWETGKKDPCWVLHTSGSTGDPKPIVRYLDSVASTESNNLLPRIDGRPLLLHDYFDTRVYLTFPLFHTAGLCNGLLWPIFYGTTVVLGPQGPVNLTLMKEVIRYSKVSAVFTAPSIVQEISRDEEFLVLLEQLKAIAYGGGPLPQDAGERIIKHTKLVLSIGTTETGWMPCVETDLEDWNYVHFHPNTGYEFEDRGSGLYELMAIRKPELEKWQPIFSTFPDLQEYSFKDLFSQHPTKPGLFTYQGRADNVIVLSNGEKFHPHAMELAIGAHPAVSSVIVAGQGRFQISLLVEPIDYKSSVTEEQRENIIKDLWSIIGRANLDAPTHAKLFKEYIIIASPDKSFLRTSKGTVRRGPTLQLYQEDLDQLYSRADLDDSLDEDKLLLDSSSEQNLKDGVRDIVKSLTSLDSLNDDDDIFTIGVDSLQVMALQRVLRRRIRNIVDSKYLITTTLIYGNPTINSLSRALYHISSPKSNENGHTASSEFDSSMVQDLIDKFSDFSDYSANRSEEAKAVIILTGSTGSLGSYLLDAIMRSDKIQEVWCLNRSTDSKTRQKGLNLRRGLNTDLECGRVYFRQANLSQQKLGLAEEDYVYLVNHATHIIHTQWLIDFNLSVTSFTSHIHGVRRLIDLGIEAKTKGRQISVFFTSSIGVANGKASGAVAEKPIADYSAARTGYGQSKLVAEQLLFAAAEKTGLQTSVCRIGQIAGPVREENRPGKWNRKEWLPSIIDATSFLSTVPQTLAKNEWVEWIPVDILSDIILELALQPSPQHNGRVFHCVNPTAIRWEKVLLPVIQSRLQKVAPEKTLRTVPWAEWVELLDDAAAMKIEDNNSSLSAWSLVEFFRSFQDINNSDGRVWFETSVTAENSRSFQALGPVNADWMNIWLDQWGYPSVPLLNKSY